MLELAITKDQNRIEVNKKMDNVIESVQANTTMNENETRNVDLRCCVVSKKTLKWTVIGIAITILVIEVSVLIIAKSLPKHKSRSLPLDQDTESGSPTQDPYTEALHKALLFFDAQKCTLIYP